MNLITKPNEIQASPSPLLFLQICRFSKKIGLDRTKLAQLIVLFALLTGLILIDVYVIVSGTKYKIVIFGYIS